MLKAPHLLVQHRQVVQSVAPFRQTGHVLHGAEHHHLCGGRLLLQLEHRVQDVQLLRLLLVCGVCGQRRSAGEALVTAGLDGGAIERGGRLGF